MTETQCWRTQSCLDLSVPATVYGVRLPAVSVVHQVCQPADSAVGVERVGHEFQSRSVRIARELGDLAGRIVSKIHRLFRHGIRSRAAAAGLLLEAGEPVQVVVGVGVLESTDPPRKAVCSVRLLARSYWLCLSASKPWSRHPGERRKCCSSKSA